MLSSNSCLPIMDCQCLLTEHFIVKFISMIFPLPVCSEMYMKLTYTSSGKVEVGKECIVKNSLTLKFLRFSRFPRNLQNSIHLSRPILVDSLCRTHSHSHPRQILSLSLSSVLHCIVLSRILLRCLS